MRSLSARAIIFVVPVAEQRGGGGGGGRANRRCCARFLSCDVGGQ